MRTLSIFAVVFGLSFFAFIVQVNGQGLLPVWTSPQLMGDGWWQSLTVDRAGTAHLGWYGGVDNHDLLMYRARPLNGEFSPATDIIYTGDGGYTVRNSLGVTSQGILFADYRDGTDHMVSSVLAVNASDPSSWQIPSLVGTGYYLDLLVDDQDNIHVVSSTQTAPPPQLLASTNFEQLPCNACGDLIYRRSTDAGKTWTTPVNLTETPWTGADRMDIWQGKSGRIYIDWDEGLDWYIGRGQTQSVEFVYSDDHGATWSEPVILDGGDYTDRKPIQMALAELDDGSLMAVWRYDTDQTRYKYVYYQLSSDLGETWTQPEPIPGIYNRESDETPLDDYELVTDLAGVVHFFGVGVASLTGDVSSSLYHVEFRQGQWRPPQIIYTGSRTVWPEWPKAAVGPLNDIHLSWFIREDWYSDHPDLKVYYAYRSGTLPADAVQGYAPTSTPLPTLVALPVFEATPTLIPTVVPMDPNIQVETSQDRYATETLLAVLLISIILSVGAFAFQRFVWRR